MSAFLDGNVNRVENVIVDDYYVSGKVVSMYQNVSLQWIGTIFFERLRENRVIDCVWWRDNVFREPISGKRELDSRTYKKGQVKMKKKVRIEVESIPAGLRENTDLVEQLRAVVWS
jgi:hypothetical protein